MASKRNRKNKPKMLSLYKFRPLGDVQDFCRALEIIRTGEFWCSRFWDLNDPMEGVFTIDATQESKISDIFSAKANFAICSFSGKKAFQNPMIWGHYSNAFKGIAIEITVEDSAVEKVTYHDGVKDVLAVNNNYEVAQQILTRKLKSWTPEREYRYLKDEAPGPRRVGTITHIYFGDPYGNLSNSDEVRDNVPGIRCYHYFRDQLKGFAERRCPPISVSDVHVKNGKVEAPQ